MDPRQTFLGLAEELPKHAEIESSIGSSTQAFQRWPAVLN
jgi:hypothetical protein